MVIESDIVAMINGTFEYINNYCDNDILCTNVYRFFIVELFSKPGRFIILVSYESKYLILFNANIIHNSNG
jgi:hypothetical protein